MKTALEELIEEFERLKDESETLKDKIYLDGVLSVIDGFIEKDKEQRKQLDRVIKNVLSEGYKLKSHHNNSKWKNALEALEEYSSKYESNETV